jgi:hypothetical protein
MIIEIQSQTDLKINLINNTIIKFKIKETVNKEVQLENTWNKYKNKTIESLNYIKKIGLIPPFKIRIVYIINLFRSI